MPGFYGSNGSDTLQRIDLDMAVLKYDALAQREGLIGLKIAPEVTVGGKTGKFPVVNESQINQKLQSDERSADGEFNRIRITHTTDTYSTTSYGLESAIDREEREIYVDEFDQESLIAEALDINILKNHEARVITLAAAAPSAATSIGTVWTASNSTPVTDMVNVKLELRDKGRTFRLDQLKLVLDFEVVEKLRLNTEIKDSLSANMNKLPSEINNSLLAIALGVGEVVVANSWQTTSPANTVEDNVARSLQWDPTKGFLCIASASKSQGFRWANTLRWIRAKSGFEQYYEPKIDNDVLRRRMNYGLKQVDAKSALFISGVKS